ncbi:alpha-ketoacid dehydrogenase subunit beta [Gordonia sp. VNK21]|uniref:alpha-ketoacid dehydrogenase subunit beta n=1 Tax=Gordonia sp. VNK21 TaxID=3382483 RepID=UPI0038D44002
MSAPESMPTVPPATRMMGYDEAVDHALAQAMTSDDRVVTWGEDVKLLRRNLLAQFGPKRVLDTPISESAFMYAGIGAAMAGLKPVVELYMIDFAAVGWAAIVNGASKFPDFSGGRVTVPLVIRAGYGGWYTDGGQHEQAFWGAAGSYPSTNVVVPATPADAAGLMTEALRRDEFTVFLTPKLLDAQMLDYLGGDSRPTVDFSALQPTGGATGEVPLTIEPIPFGRATVRRDGPDVVLISVGVGVHRCLEAAEALAGLGIGATVLDLRTVAPLDTDAIVQHAARTGRIVVVDEDYRRAGLTGEIAALLLESGIPAEYRRVAVEETIPFAPHLEYETLPNVERIIATVEEMTGDGRTERD